MKLALETIVWDGWVALDVPKKWNIDDHEDGGFSIYPPKGQGTLELSFFHREAPEPPSAQEVAAMTERFCQEQGWPVEPDAVEALTLGGQPGACVEAMEEGETRVYWKVWHALDATRVVLATYCAPDGDTDEEVAVCDRVLASLKWV